MDLILWRHAEAEEGGFDRPDLERCLTPRGNKQASGVACWLRRHLPAGCRILASPAVRTRQTCDALGLAYEIEPRIGPAAAIADVIAAADWPAAGGAVLVVGHQPTLGRLAAMLMAGIDADWSVKKGGLWWLSRRKRATDDRTVLRAVLGPEWMDV